MVASRRRYKYGIIACHNGTVFKYTITGVMMGNVTYESICEKLGFDVDTYQPPMADTEDVNGESPFRKLTFEELNFLTDRREHL